MTDYTDRLAEIEQRANAAIEGPWRVYRERGSSGGEAFGVESPRDDVEDSGEGWSVAFELDEPDAEFIAHAREDVPRLVAFAREVLAALDSLSTSAANASKFDAYHEGRSDALDRAWTVAHDLAARHFGGES